MARNSSKTKENKSPKKGKGFFAIDRQTWTHVLDNFGMNEAIAYLVLAQGTGGDNSTTSWSINSLRTYTGIAYARGKPAIERLIDAEVIRHAVGHSIAKPRYKLLTWAEIEPRSYARQVAALTDHERLIFSRLPAAGKGKYQLATLNSLQTRGLVKEVDYHRFERVEPAAAGAPDPIWLPNTVVTGTDSGEEPPLRWLRSDDIWTLRLFVDLYHAHNLRDDGGVARGVLWNNYDKKQIGEQGIFNIWAFKSTTTELNWSADPFTKHKRRQKIVGQDHPVWSDIRRLEEYGLLSFVPHLWESDSAQAEIIHPYGIKGIGGEPIEINLGDAAHRAGLFMGSEYQIQQAINEGYRHFAPIKKQYPNVQLFGMARLTYRPHTKRTSDWYAELQGASARWVRTHQELSQKAEIARRASPVKSVIYHSEYASR